MTQASSSPSHQPDKQQMIIMNKYRVLSKKGEGTFSEVLKVEHVHSGHAYAVKCMKSLYPSIKHVNELREIQALRRLNPHPNIVSMEEILYDPETGRLAIVLELMQMNVYELIRHRREPLDGQLVCSLMHQLLTAICHMHDHGVFHRDIKPENVLLVNGSTLKVADLGSCRGLFSQPPYTEYISTRWYRAPECLLTNGYYDYKMDIWGIGCVFYELVSLQPLFPGANELDQIEKIHTVLGTPSKHLLTAIQQRGGAATPNIKFSERKGSGYRHMLPKTLVGDDMVDLIDQMLIYNPDKRITARQALNHSYFDAMRAKDKAKDKDKDDKKERVKDKVEQHQERKEADTAADTPNAQPTTKPAPLKPKATTASPASPADADEEYAPDADHTTSADQQRAARAAREAKEAEVAVDGGAGEAVAMAGADKATGLGKEVKRKKKKDKVREIIAAGSASHSPHVSPKQATTTLQANINPTASSFSSSSHLSSTLQPSTLLPASSALAAPHTFSQTHPNLSALYPSHHPPPVVPGKAAEVVPLPQLQHHLSPKAKAVPLLSSTTTTSTSASSFSPLLPAPGTHAQHPHAHPPHPAPPAAAPLLVPLSVSSELHSHAVLYGGVRVGVAGQPGAVHGGGVVGGGSLSSLPGAVGWKEKRRKRRKKQPGDQHSTAVLNNTQEIKTHNTLPSQLSTSQHSNPAMPHSTAAYLHQQPHQPSYPHQPAHYQHHKPPNAVHATEMPPLLIAAAVPTSHATAASHLHPPAYHHAYSIVADGGGATGGSGGGGKKSAGKGGGGKGGGGGAVGFGSLASQKPSHFLSKLHTPAPAVYQRAAR